MFQVEILSLLLSFCTAHITTLEHCICFTKLTSVFFCSASFTLSVLAQIHAFLIVFCITVRSISSVTIAKLLCFKHRNC